MALLSVPLLATSSEEAQIKSDEGFSLEAYRDRGGWAVGWGHHQPYHSVISLEEAERLFEEDYTKARGYALRAAPEAPEEVVDILTNMAYNLGGAGLNNFNNMLEHVNRKCYEEAAFEMVRSDWYDQVGLRAVRLSFRMFKLGNVGSDCQPTLTWSGGEWREEPRGTTRGQDKG